MTRIDSSTIQHTEAPLTATFTTALRSVSVLYPINFTITSGGKSGVGSTVETPAITGDTREEIEAGLQEISAKISGYEFKSASDFYNDCLVQIHVAASAKAAADLAGYSLQTILEGKSTSDLLGASMGKVKTDVTIPIAPIDEIEKLVSDRIGVGFSYFKVKLNREPMDILLSKVRLISQLSPNLLRIDPNQSWDKDFTLEFLAALDRAGIGIDYLEQPTPKEDRQALVDIRQSSGVKIMADESVFKTRDLRELIELGGVDLVNLKIVKSGGITPLLESAELARQNGIAISIGSMMEGEIGVNFAALLAASLAPEAIHDLDAGWWLRQSSLKYHDGYVEIIR